MSNININKSKIKGNIIGNNKIENTNKKGNIIYSLIKKIINILVGE